METRHKVGELASLVKLLEIEDLVERKYAKAKNPDGTLKEKTGKREYVKALQKFYLKDSPSQHLLMALQTYPQLAARQNQLKPEQLENIWLSTEWCCEEKFRGFRLRVIYNQKEGWHWYQRYISEKTFLPLEVLTLPTDYTVDDKITSFVLDGELVAKDPQELIDFLDSEGYQLENDLEAVTFVMTNSIAGFDLIKFPMEYKVFDILEINGTLVTSEEYTRRRAYMVSLLQNIQGNNLVKIEKVESYLLDRIGKKAFFDQIIEAGGEGFIAKDIHSVYEVDGRPTTWIKFKREQSDLYVHKEVPVGETDADNIGQMDVSELLKQF